MTDCLADRHDALIGDAVENLHAVAAFAQYASPIQGRLIRENAAVAGSQFNYAIGKLVLWSAKPAVVDGAGEVLKHGGFDHLAIANPKLAPYGAAAVEVMKALGCSSSLAYLHLRRATSRGRRLEPWIEAVAVAAQAPR